MYDNTLYIIVPYFNFINYKSGIKNLEIFINNLQTYKNVQMVLVEGYYQDQQLPDYSTKIFKHIKVHLKHVLWVKENLINIGFNCLPPEWQYGGWIDRDIMFCNPNWALETIEKLKEYDVVQPWKEFIWLDSEHNFNATEDYSRSTNRNTYFSAAYIINNVETTPCMRKLYPWPGHAWCITKTFYKKINHLYEYCIVGGGDDFFLNTIKQHKCKLSYVDGLIIHYFHGTRKNRQYVRRYNILVKNNFNPLQDLKKNEDGVLCFTDVGLRLEQPIKKYFLERSE